MPDAAEMSAAEETHVVTCFLRNRGEVLLLRRSDEVGSYQGRWGGVAGHAEGDPDAAARNEIDEETGLLSACTFVRRGASFPVDDDELGTRWVVHPYLFECSDREVSLDWESVEAEWVPPPEILRRETVPALWTSYRRVAPSVDSVRDDRDHGSAWLSLRALEVLRDAAVDPGSENAWPDLARIAEDLLAARPAMSAVQQRVHRAMSRAGGDAGLVAACAQEVLAEAQDADQRAAEQAADLIQGQHVLTLSRSGTVSAALRTAGRRVTVLESRPLGEGRTVAEELCVGGRDVTLAPDAAAAWLLDHGEIDVILVGADAVTSAGGVVNKVGTRVLAELAGSRGVPCYVVAAADKIAPPEHDRADVAEAPRADLTEVYDGAADLQIVDVLFEHTPAEWITGIVTEDGVLDRQDVVAVAGRHARERRWREPLER